MNIFKPPLPTYIPILENKEKQMDLWLESGTHYFHFKEGSKSYQGTLRVSYTESKDAIAISADIYEVSYDIDSVQEYKLPSVEEYHSYWRINKLTESLDNTLSFELLEFVYLEKALKAKRALIIDISTYHRTPKIDLRFGRNKLDTFHLMHLSNSFRKISIEIVVEEDSKVPDSIKDSNKWAGLEIEAEFNTNPIFIDSRTRWTERQLSDELQRIKLRFTDLNSQWKYFMFCVKTLRPALSGFVFTEEASAKAPAREGAAVSSHWNLPIKNREIFEYDEAYSRVFFHELGHLFGLGPEEENTFGLMTPTPDMITKWEEDFLDNIKFKFSPGEQKIIRHISDAYFRPRMKDYNTITTGTIPEYI